LWLQASVHDFLPSLVFRTDLILDVDSRASTLEERKSLRRALHAVGSEVLEWSRSEVGHTDWLAVLLYLIEELAGERHRFFDAGIDSDLFNSVVKDALNPKREIFDMDEQSISPFRFLHAQARFDERDRERVAKAVLSDVWRYVLIERVLCKLVKSPSLTGAFFVDEDFRGLVTETAKRLASSVIDDGDPLRLPTVSTKQLANAAGCSESQIRTLKAKGIITPVTQGTTSQGQSWDLTTCLRQIRQYSRGQKQTSS